MHVSAAQRAEGTSDLCGLLRCARRAALSCVRVSAPRLEEEDEEVVPHDLNRTFSCMNGSCMVPAFRKRLGEPEEWLQRCVKKCRGPRNKEGLLCCLGDGDPTGWTGVDTGASAAGGLVVATGVSGAGSAALSFGGV